MFTKERAAIHEAAHAVIAIVRGAPLAETRSFQDTTGKWVGDSTAVHQFGGGVPVEDIALQIAELFAGTVADRIAGYAPPVERKWASIWAEIKRLGDNLEQGWGNDFLQAKEIARASYPYGTAEEVSALLSWGWMQADELLRAHWPAVEAIAEGILRSDSLSLFGDEARSIAAASGLEVPVNPELERRAKVRLTGQDTLEA